MVTLVLHGSNKFIADSSKYRSKTEKGNSVTYYVWSLIQVLTLQCKYFKLNFSEKYKDVANYHMMLKVDTKCGLPRASHKNNGNNFDYCDNEDNCINHYK